MGLAFGKNFQSPSGTESDGVEGGELESGTKSDGGDLEKMST